MFLYMYQNANVFCVFSTLLYFISQRFDLVNEIENFEIKTQSKLWSTLVLKIVVLMV